MKLLVQNKKLIVDVNINALINRLQPDDGCNKQITENNDNFHSPVSIKTSSNEILTKLNKL